MVTGLSSRFMQERRSHTMGKNWLLTFPKISLILVPDGDMTCFSSGDFIRGSGSSSRVQTRIPCGLVIVCDLSLAPSIIHHTLKMSFSWIKRKKMNEQMKNNHSPPHSGPAPAPPRAGRGRSHRARPPAHPGPRQPRDQRPESRDKTPSTARAGRAERTWTRTGGSMTSLPRCHRVEPRQGNSRTRIKNRSVDQILLSNIVILEL